MPQLGSAADDWISDPITGCRIWTDEVDTETLAEWLRNPTELKAMQPGAGYGMPDLNLSEDEIEALVAYLLTLE